jgi:shikimate kinase
VAERAVHAPKRTKRAAAQRPGVVVSKPQLPIRVFLVGFMGSGKTTVGKLIAERLHWSFVDLDRRIEEVAGKKIRAIFSDDGEGRFRRLENDVLREVARDAGRAVIALGGGAFVSEVNRAVIRRSGVSVWLDVPIRALVGRALGDRRRPLAATAEQMNRLYRSRLPFYHEADVRLRVGDASADRIAVEAIKLLREDWQIVAERRRLFP